MCLLNPSIKNSVFNVSVLTFIYFNSPIYPDTLSDSDPFIGAHHQFPSPLNPSLHPFSLSGPMQVTEMKGHKITSRCLESTTNALCHLNLISKTKAKLELKEFFPLIICLCSWTVCSQFSMLSLYICRLNIVGYQIVAWYLRLQSRNLKVGSETEGFL